MVTFFPAAGSGGKRVARLKAEAPWLVARAQRDLAQIFDVGMSGDQLFVVAEYVETNLAALIAQGGALPAAVTAAIVLHTCAALEFIRQHEESSTGVSSRLAGLSAASILLDRNGRVKVMHPGAALAVAGDALDSCSPAVVSLVAPEHVSGGGSARGDVFAMGALLWQALTGRPFAGEDVAAHLGALRAGQWWPALPRSPGPSGAAEALVGLAIAALSARAEDRPGGLEVVRSELSGILGPSTDGSEPAIARLIEQRLGVALVRERKEIAALIATAESAERVSAPARNPMQSYREQPRRSPKTVGLSDLSGPIDHELMMGEVIPGSRYRLLEKLGEGGMGAVYRAEHIDIERKVALKVLHSQLTTNPVVLGQFRQEARAASRLGNPYIADLTDWGEMADGRVFYVMEYVDGPSLDVALNVSRRFTPERMIPIARQVAKALGAAHEKGIVHLDVKPANVLLVERDGREAVKIVDFGVARFIDPGTSSKVMGTPEYMAPERAAGKGYDHRSDIYSMGVMLWEMLVGESLFEGKTPVETLALHVEEPPDRINEHVRTPVPDGLEAVVMQMLAKRPADRPQSMVEVEALLIEAQIEAKLVTPWDDDLALPSVDAERAARLARGLRSQRGILSKLRRMVSPGTQPGVRAESPTPEPESVPDPPPTKPFPAYLGKGRFVFISYAHRDREVVYAELSRLQGSGVNIWYDEGIPASTVWGKVLTEQIDRCEVFLVFFSRSSVQSENVLNELNYALQDARKRKLVVVHLERCEVPREFRLHLGRIQAILRHELDEATYRRRLDETIQRLLQ